MPPLTFPFLSLKEGLYSVIQCIECRENYKLAIAGSEMVEVKVSDSIRKQPPPVKIIGNFIFKGKSKWSMVVSWGCRKAFSTGCPKPVPY